MSSRPLFGSGSPYAQPSEVIRRNAFGSLCRDAPYLQRLRQQPTESLYIHYTISQDYSEGEDAKCRALLAFLGERSSNGFGLSALGQLQRDRFRRMNSEIIDSVDQGTVSGVCPIAKHPYDRDSISKPGLNLKAEGSHESDGVYEQSTGQIRERDPPARIGTSKFYQFGTVPPRSLSATERRRLPASQRSSEESFPLKLRITVIAAIGLHQRDVCPDVYASIDIDFFDVVSTSVIPGNLNPYWNETFDVRATEDSTFEIKIFDGHKDAKQSRYLGRVSARVGDIIGYHDGGNGVFTHDIVSRVEEKRHGKLLFRVVLDFT